MGNYSAVIVRISNIRKHENADRLQITNIFGNSVVLGLDAQVGDLGVYFQPETQLSEEFARANDLIRRKDAQGKAAGGMLEDSRRVKTIKLRGEKSMGLWLPLSCLDTIGGRLSKPEGNLEGFEFEEMNGIPICKKYIPKVSLTNGSGKVKTGRKPRESKVIDGQFHFHFDTAQLGKNIHRINPDDLVSITWKLHGTSAIASKSLVRKPLNFLSKLGRKIGLEIKDAHYDYLYASRRVVKNEFMDEKQHFYSYDLWTEVGKHFEGLLYNGESVYYEIVGFLKDGGAIQKGFDYKCEPGTHKIYVYRITRTSSDGVVTELQWNQVKQRCSQLNVNHVPEIFYGKANDLFDLEESQHWNENYLNSLKDSFVFDQDSIFCNNQVPEEGICIRKEGLEIEVFKLKSFKFLEYETKALDTNQTDIETEQTVA